MIPGSAALSRRGGGQARVGRGHEHMRAEQENGHRVAGGMAAVQTRVNSGLDGHRTVVAAGIALLALVLALRGRHGDTHTELAIAAAFLLVARGLALGRPLLVTHVATALTFVLAAAAAHHTGHLATSYAFAVAAGAVTCLPRRAPSAADEHDRRHAWALVDRSAGDTLAPFALRSDKTFVFTDDRSAAVAYRVRLGTAIASGDPIGAGEAREAAIDAFLSHAEANGWRAAVLGASERTVDAWRRHGLRALSIGRDVMVDVETFSLEGR